MRPRKQWIVVAAPGRARVLRCPPHRDDGPPPELVLRAESRRLRDILTDRPGRSFSSGSGGRRSAMEPGTDPLHEDMQDFVRQIVALLETHRLAQDFDELVLVATPQMLGAIRDGMPRSLRPMVTVEIARNLATASAEDLPALVARAIEDQRT